MIVQSVIIFTSWMRERCVSLPETTSWFWIYKQRNRNTFAAPVGEVLVPSQWVSHPIPSCEKQKEGSTIRLKMDGIGKWGCVFHWLKICFIGRFIPPKSILPLLKRENHQTSISLNIHHWNYIEFWGVEQNDHTPMLILSKRNWVHVYALKSFISTFSWIIPE